MKVSDGIYVPNANVGCNMYCVNLNNSLYDLKLKVHLGPCVGFGWLMTNN
jgi:hypothetical protein